MDGLIVRGRRMHMVRELATLCLFLGIAGLVLHVTGIGCPIKYLTGVSCPGCGMTRAWLSVAHGDLRQAMAFHPLFWVVPIVFVACVAEPGAKSPVVRAGLMVAIAALLVLWVARLTSPHDALILTGADSGPDYISVQRPVWLDLLFEIGLIG